MTLLKKVTLTMFIMFASTLSLLFVANAQTSYVSADSESCVVSSKSDFYNALSTQKNCIKIDNIDFGGETIQLNYNVTISANCERATIQNAYFVIKGSITDDFAPTITFENITFDGTVNAENYNLTQSASYETIFAGEREDTRCINGDYGYYNLKIDNCTIKNYSSITGPCVYVENSMRDYEKLIEITNSKFYNNISEYDTLHLSNDKNNVKIYACEFYNNYAYKAAGFSIANGKANIDNVKVYNNYFCEYDVDKNNLQLCGGGIYLGGVDTTLTNSSITNNKTTFGGGLGISSSSSGNKQIVIENVEIKNNQANFGGAVCAHSLAGQTINFINCDISNNRATTGSAFYTSVYAYWLSSNNGGLINLFFCSVLLNTANDANTFGYYNTNNTKGLLGNFAIKGCFIVGNDTLQSNEEDYNYVATLDTALSDGAVPKNITQTIATKNIYPSSKSKADIKVAPEIYHNWSKLLTKYTKTLNVGKNETTSLEPFNIWITIIPCICLFVVGSGVLIVFASKRKTKVKQNIALSQTEQNQDIEKESQDCEEITLLKSLTERELKIVEMSIHLKKRKEIADELCFSENTIKKDLTSIYAKLKVQDKNELISKYKDFI